MASVQNEMAFVATFWRTIESNADEDRTRAWKAAAAVQPDIIENEELRKIYDNLRIRYSEGETTELPIVHADIQCDYEWLCDLQESSLPPSVLNDYALVLVRSAQSDEFRGLCMKAIDYLDANKAKDGGKAAAEQLALRLMAIYTGSTDSSHGMKSREQVVDEAKARAMQEISGVTLPWPKLESACGPLIPGEIVGVSAYSGEGKSTFVGNLFSGLIDQGVPCIPVPTEMGVQWMDRVVASRARVEQWRAEKRKWHGAEDQRQEFLQAYDAIRSMEWLMVGRMDISPAEVATAVRVLRKRWNGPVVFIVDHMHRLNYGNEEADKMAGKATQMMKNLAGELGLIGVLLYQPRKPPMGQTHHGPVAGHQIRGHSSIWNELDVHLSPFRAWVKTDISLGLAYKGTPYESVACAYDDNDRPKFTKPDDEFGKLDDQHAYIKVDKRRVGGEGPTVVLNYDKRTGRIYETTTIRQDSRNVA